MCLSFDTSPFAFGTDRLFTSNTSSVCLNCIIRFAGLNNRNAVPQ